MLDPKTKKYKFIDTCFGTHHPQFGYDADNTLWLSGTGPVAGWVNTKVFDETGDAEKALGWFPFVLDTNGNGKLDEFAEPDKPEDGQGHALQSRLRALCGDAASDRRLGLVHLRRVRRRGRASCASIRRPSSASSIELPKEAIGLRGGDIGKDGVLYGSGSAGHLIAFDRRKCKAPLNGPNATGNHCPEGFTLHKYPGPGFDDVPNSSAEASYYTWVDHHNAVGLGDERPDLDRQPPGRLRRPGQRQDGPDARAVPDGLLRQGSRRPHRRSERRLEGPRLCGAPAATARPG